MDSKASDRGPYRDAMNENNTQMETHCSIITFYYIEVKIKRVQPRYRVSKV